MAAGLSWVYAPVWMVLYWLGLGVMSSIGLGTGLHTGALYLAPHVLQASTTWSALPAAISWGIGSGLGELPPYWICRSSRQNPPETLKRLLDTSFGRTTERLVRHWGGLAILPMACWPNATFDACGIVSGYLGVPVGTFVISTVTGKAFIKAPIQVWALRTGMSTISTGWFNPLYLNVATTLVLLYFLYRTVQELAGRERAHECALKFMHTNLHTNVHTNLHTNLH